MTELYTPAYKPTGEEIAVLTTSKGAIRVQLAGNDAPIHVGNFVELARDGFYDGLKFHRYVPGFGITRAVFHEGDMIRIRIAGPGKENPVSRLRNIIA